MAERITVDGNEAAAMVAHNVSEVIAIYPITPASTMGELAEAWSAAGRTNLWGRIPTILELQSEGGAAGTIHSAAQAKRPDHDLHCLPGPPADAAENVQIGRRTHAHRHPRRCPLGPARRSGAMCRRVELDDRGRRRDVAVAVSRPALQHADRASLPAVAAPRWHHRGLR